MYHAKWDSQVLLLILAFSIILLLAQVLLESFYSDPDLVYKKAGVTDPDLLLPVEEQQVCGICYDDLSLVAAHCGHSSCVSCWREHVTTRLEAGRALTLDCPACPALLQEDLVAKVHLLLLLLLLLVAQVAPSPLLLRYEHQLCEAVVERTGVMTWCGGPGCGGILR